MAGKFKTFVSNCYRAGQNMAYEITPPVLQDAVVPYLGAVLGATVVPVVGGVLTAYDMLDEKRQLWARGNVGDAEKSISEVFGNISAEGYRHWGGGITLKLEEARVYSICHTDGKVSPEADYCRTDTHYDREQCAKDMLGNLAGNAAGYSRSLDHARKEKRVIVVRKAGETSSRFYQAAQIDSPADAPANAIVATHHYYKSGIGHGGIEKETFFAITPVEERVAASLQRLGL